MRGLVLKLRRYLLKVMVPEFVWPNEIEIDDVVIRLRGAPYSFGIKRLLTKNPDAYEKAERKFLKVLKADDHVLEFGSSIGVLTALICERVSAGRVISIEVSKPLLDYSRSWLSRYQQLTLIHAAAFPIYKRIDLELSFNDSSGSLGGIVSYQSSSECNDKLDSFFISDSEKVAGFLPTVLVIDIEGSEDIMLREEVSLPKSIDRVIIELHAFLYGVDVEQRIVERILQEGFELQERLESVYFFTRIV